MRLGQEGLILKQRIAVAGPTSADACLDWDLRARGPGQASRKCSSCGGGCG